MEPTAAPTAETTAPDPVEVAREEHAAGVLERAVEHAAPAPPPPATPAAASAPPPPAPAEPSPPQTPAAAEPSDPRLHPASRRFFERVTERAQRRAQEALADRLQRAADAIERQAQGQPPAEPAAAEPDFDTDPKAWYQAEMARQLREAVGPLVQAHQQQQETEQQFQQRQINEAQQAAWQESMATEMDYSRELYSQTPEGELFDQRFDWFVNDFMTPALMATGLPADQAQEMATIGVQAWVQFAINRRVDPSLFVDNIIRSQVGSVASVLIEAGFQPPNGQAGNGNGRQTGAAPQRRAPNPEIASLQQTAASASSVAGIARQTSAPRRSGSSAVAVAADPTVENIRALAEEEFGGDVRKATAAVRRAALASEQVAR